MKDKSKITTMKVIKRNSKLEELSFDKILRRIKNLCKEEPVLKYVDSSVITQKTIQRIYDKISTEEIDELSAQIAISHVTENLEYGSLASRIIISNNQKNNCKTFTECVKKLKDYNENLIADDIYDFIMNNEADINSMIDSKRDFNFDYFGYKTLERSYLGKINGKVSETPQYMILRVSLGIHFDPNMLKEDILFKTKETYDMMSMGLFTHATPTLFNSGSKRPQLASCFLLSTHDSAIGIYKTISDCALISKWSGGIGVNIQDIRAKDSIIKGTNGKSDGIVPMLKVYNATARYMNQGSKRNGSFAIYIEPFHADIFDFLDLKKNTGAEEIRARDLFYALWIPNIFMECVEKDLDWHLMCPHECPGLTETYGEKHNELYKKYVSEGKFRKVVKARELWNKILESQIETGTPYLLYKDPCNEMSNQKNLGTIKSSNLCVAPETKILTSEGYFEISSLEGQTVKVWNGEEFSETLVVKTNTNTEVVTVKLSDGTSIDCTEYHKFFDNKNNVIRAGDLSEGKILKNPQRFPVIDGKEEFANKVSAKTAGLFYISGIEQDNKKFIVFDAKNYYIKYQKDILSDIVSQKLEGNQIYSQLKDEVPVYAPINCSIKTKVDWVTGLFKSSTYIDMKKQTAQFVIDSSKSFDVKLLFNTIGIMPKIDLKSQAGYEVALFTFDVNQICKMVSLGVDLPSPNISKRECWVFNYTKVVSIERHNRMTDVFCFTEPLKNSGIFNGILTGNCSEIIQYSAPDEVAVCNLSSIALPKFIENGVYNLHALKECAYKIVYNMNKVIDRNYYPIPETKTSNMKNRPIGIGVQGLADAFIIMRYPFDSEEARKLNYEIFEAIYFGCVQASCDLAKKEGYYETFPGSPYSMGLFQFDLQNRSDIIKNSIWDWENLRKDVMKHGLRNSLLTAVMPTASTSQILGNTECIEAIQSNIFTRTTLSGEFIVINKYLVKDLQEFGLWSTEMKDKIIFHQGSVQQIQEIPSHIKKLYKTVWEISQRVVIDLSADRALFIDQSQSLNLFVEKPTIGKLTSMHFYAYKKGLKTGCYYLRSKAARNAVQFTIDPKMEKQNSEDNLASITCSLENPESCEMCSG